jgi:hypothetical protein
MARKTAIDQALDHEDEADGDDEVAPHCALSMMLVSGGSAHA